MKRSTLLLILTAVTSLLLTIPGCQEPQTTEQSQVTQQSPIATRPQVGQPDIINIQYPSARRSDVVDTYHGVKVPDPYQWLEDPESEETLTWVNAQNKLTEAYIADIDQREKIEKRLTQLLNYPRYSAPYKQGGQYFFWKNSGLQNQSVLYTQKTLDAQPTVVINPNLLSKDGTIAVSTTAVSEDAAYMAYGLSTGGSDEQQIKIKNLATGKDLPETLNHCRFTSIAWKHDTSGFYYNRFPAKGQVPDEDLTNHNKVYYHALKTDQSADPLIHEDPENKELGFSPHITEDGKYLLLIIYHGTDPRNRIYYRPVESDQPFTKLLDKADARYDFLGNVGPTFYFNTDQSSPKGRIIAIDTNNPAPDKWKTILAESEDVLDSAAIVSDHLVVAYMHNVHHQPRIYDLAGKLIRDIPLPAIGTVTGLSGRQDDPEMFFTFTSFLYPPTIYRYDFTTDNVAVFRKPEIDFDPKPYKTTQIFARSADGTRIPIFVTHKKSLSLDRNNPTILYGYGGFNISRRPSFSTSTLVWLELGGIYAVANIRGGAEYGEQWHQDGMLDRKQNVFDDFHAAAQYLIRSNYTSTKKLAIRGGSNGGLLVAACMLQQPGLYRAVICQVPVIDMLRYHRFTVGRYWVPEYGNAENSREEFDYLHAYSPLHNVRPQGDYPPILITSADTDDRVVPSHSKKFAATLQAKSPKAGPILLRVETKAGHGGGKPVSKVIEEQSDIFAFLYKTLEMTEPEK